MQEAGINDVEVKRITVVLADRTAGLRIPSSTTDRQNSSLRFFSKTNTILLPVEYIVIFYF